MYLKKLKIGNVELLNNIILAPMAGITDQPFRKICKEFGVGLVCTEMASSKAIFYNDIKTKSILKIEGEQRPIQAQIFGSDIEALKASAKYVSKFADILDINMGCPAPKVVKNGEGSKLLLNLDLVGEIVTNVVEASTIPVTVKIRKGWNKEKIVAQEAAKIIQKAGASAITIHGRTREEYFSGEVDLDIIKKVKQSVDIPVIGNGNIKDEETAKKMFEYTGVDGIMIGRAAIGNPWIFEQIIHYLETGERKKEYTNKEKLKIIIKHIELEVEEKGEKVGIQELRKHMAYYTKNIQEASKLRQKINTIDTKEKLIKTLQEYYK
ncbi:MAG: tRNA dihydrouridine synthase DusB [Clostridia bacterium]|nr:tRNA dihydrouridine synthase DusB [Clostridia bacterium]